MDEKWFCAIVVRRNNKCIPHLGVAPLSADVHHWSHICKMMVICSEHFAPFGDDMTKGGMAGKVSATRVGHMVKAQKDSHRRVHKEDGSFACPKVPENLMRRKGEEYFEPLEICGGTSSRSGKAKFSLLDWFLEAELPRLDDVAAELETKLGKKIVMHHQMDGAGPHTDAKSLEVLDKQFAQRGWILRFQPANSPLTNANGACVFPCMSKAATADQGLSNGSVVLQAEELWSTVQKVWNNLLLDTIAVRLWATIKQQVPSRNVRVATSLQRPKVDFILALESTAYLSLPMRLTLHPLVSL